MVRLKVKAMGVETVPPHRSDKGWLGVPGGGLALVVPRGLLHHLHDKNGQTVWRERQAQGPHNPSTPPIVATGEGEFSRPSTFAGCTNNERLDG
jgi:hypothetical protein